MTFIPPDWTPQFPTIQPDPMYTTTSSPPRPSYEEWLRDYFAGQVLSNCCMSLENDEQVKAIVKACYRIADFAIVARKEPKP